MLSFWEKKSTESSRNLLIIGGGIVGVSTAISYSELHPNRKVTLVERSTYPNGASTKNAGFACFGSISELLDDLQLMSEEQVIELVRSRIKGLKTLRSRVGDSQMDYEQLGGYEVFKTKQSFERYADEIPRINAMLRQILGEEVYKVGDKSASDFGLSADCRLIFNPHEGQLDPMKMMSSLYMKAQQLGVNIMMGATVSDILESGVRLDNGIELSAERVLIAVNGFAKQFRDIDVRPARAQVLITDPIPGLKLKGTFHMERGYYYFRNVGDRVLFGGGRHLDMSGEETTEIALSAIIQENLEEVLKECILPNQKFKIAQRWAGIMGVGNDRMPIIEECRPGLFCAVRLGGMGVALGSEVGEKAAQLILRSV